MSTMAVYQYELFDRASRSWRSPGIYATQAAIERMGGVILHSTMLQVAESRIGPDGVVTAQELARPARAQP